MLTYLTSEFVSRLSCAYYSTLGTTSISWFSPMWTAVFLAASYGRPEITVLPKTLGTSLRRFRIFRSKRI